MLSKYETVGVGVSIAFMALALYLVRVETAVFGLKDASTQLASVSSGAVVVDSKSDDIKAARTDAYLDAADSGGNILKLVIEDIKVGTGDEVKVGDTVEVHYIGKLQSGQEFDNSNKRGAPFSFKVGEGRVIKGWEEGLRGMKVGGERILVIPPDMAYGNQQMGPIPANSTLVFSIQLLSIK